VTADIINNISKPVSESLLKRYFSPKTELGQEALLYKKFLKEQYKSDAMASNFIEAVLKLHSKLNRKALLEQKYNLVKDISNGYDIKKFFKSPINEYKVLASIYILFEENHTSEKHDPIEIARCKNTILEHVCRPKAPSNSKDGEIISEYSHQDRDLQLLTYKLLVDRFNQKYSSKLCSRQKTLLREYINNLTNTNSLKAYTETEIPWILNKMRALHKKVDDDVTKIKLNEVMNQISKLKKTKNLNEAHVTSLLLAYELIQEIQSVTDAKTKGCN
jgi:hypothetical protein